MSNSVESWYLHTGLVDNDRMGFTFYPAKVLKSMGVNVSYFSHKKVREYSLSIEVLYSV